MLTPEQVWLHYLRLWALRIYPPDERINLLGSRTKLVYVELNLFRSLKGREPSLSEIRRFLNLSSERRIRRPYNPNLKDWTVTQLLYHIKVLKIAGLYDLKEYRLTEPSHQDHSCLYADAVNLLKRFADKYPEDPLVDSVNKLISYTKLEKTTKTFPTPPDCFKHLVKLNSTVKREPCEKKTNRNPRRTSIKRRVRSS